MKYFYSLLLSILGLSSGLGQTAHSDSSPLALSQAITNPVGQYQWLPAGQYNAKQSLVARFPTPAGYDRVAVTAGSFGQWLRYLPLLPAGTAVHLYNGKLKDRQDVHAAVLNLDTGSRDLQQCADAVMRLRGEYLFSQSPKQVHFHLTSGHDIRFEDWYTGRTFRVDGEQVLPATKVAEAPTYPVLRRYLDQIFTYAGTLSLSKEMTPVPLAQVQPGDVLIRGGSPGHAVVVLDVAIQRSTGSRLALLAQSYMPAQQMHVLKDSLHSGNAWFALDANPEQVFTPEWTFGRDELKRFQ